MIENTGVRRGQYYAQPSRLRPRPLVWTVCAIFRDSLEIPHARLESLDEPNTFKTVSCAALSNRRQYELLAEPQTEPA